MLQFIPRSPLLLCTYVTPPSKCDISHQMSDDSCHSRRLEYSHAALSKFRAKYKEAAETRGGGRRREENATHKKRVKKKRECFRITPRKVDSLAEGYRPCRFIINAMYIDFVCLPP